MYSYYMYIIYVPKIVKSDNVIGQAKTSPVHTFKLATLEDHKLSLGKTQAAEIYRICETAITLSLLNVLLLLWIYRAD